MKIRFYFFLFLLSLAGCIGDDIVFDTVEERLRIVASVDTLGLDDTYLFEARFSNNIGEVEDRTVNWISSDPGVLSIDASGLATGLKMGTALVTAEVLLDDKPAVRDTVSVIVADKTSSGNNNSERTGKIRTTSSYKLMGDFVVKEENGVLFIVVADNYEASTSLPGLYLYLTNNPATNANAKEVAAVKVFKGGHSYAVPGVSLNEYDYLLYYCKPFSVKVGDGALSK